MASVDFEQVSKVFPDGTRGLTDCTVRIDDGELLVVVGPSGCGKSTLLRIVAGLESASSGTLRIGDRVVNGLSPQQRNVAMVFQDYALYPFMTVRQNLEFPLRMRRLPREAMARQVERAAALLDIGALLDRLPKQLSGGQRQRVAMGRALVRDPSVSLLDEPLSNLDAKLRVQVRAEIGELQARTRTTMIYVTHDQVEAMTLGHRVAVLDKGRLQQVAAPRLLYDQPANTFVAGFVGNPPMNLFPVRVERGERLGLRMGGQILAVDAATLRPALPLTDGALLTAGVRPEAMTVASAEDENAVDVLVEHAEYLGFETLAYVRVNGADGPRWVARLDGMLAFSKDQPLRLRVDPARIYLFDEAGLTLRAQALPK